MIKFIARIAYTILSIIQALIIFRIAIILLALNTGNSIISWIYNQSNVFVSPFRGILENEFLNIANFKLELTSIVALFVYLIIGFVFVEIIKAFTTE